MSTEQLADLPESETEFFYKTVDAQMTFVKDNEGHVTDLILHHNGQNLRATKTKETGPAPAGLRTSHSESGSLSLSPFRRFGPHIR